MNKKIYYLYLSLFIIGLIALVFVGFKTWTQFILPNIFNIGNFSPLLFYSFAFLAGLISFFAPCAIGILPAYATYYLELRENDKGKNRFKHSLQMGSMAALGIFSLYIVLGLILTILGTSAAAYFTISKPIIAAILLIIGIGLILNYSPKSNFIYKLINNKIIKGKAKNSLFFFGILYGGAALGCAMIVFIPLVVIPLSTGQFFTGLFSFILYSLAFGIAMIITTVMVAYSKNIVIEKITASYSSIKKITGVVLILSAIYLLYYFLRFGM